MALIIFKYCLPILLGYTFFVGIAGQYIPFLRPKAPEKRPIWFLGLWMGLTISIITIVGLQLAYRMDLVQLSSLLIPGIAIMAASMLFGLIGFFWYRSRVKRRLLVDTNSLAQKNSHQKDATGIENALASATSMTDELDETVPVDTSGIPDVEDPKAQWAGNMESADLSGLGMDETIIFDEGSAQTLEPNAVDQTKAEAAKNQSDTETDTNKLSVQQAKAKTDIETDELMIDSTSNNDHVTDQFYAAGSADNHDSEKQTEPTATYSQNEIESDLTVVAEHVLADAEVILDSNHEIHALSTHPHGDDNEEDSKVLLQLREELDSERQARKELETHLRITRNGLGALESESREFESKKAAALIQVEKELEEKVKRTSAAEARAEREAAKRAELEHEIIQLREDTLKAITDSRISTEARAAALSTANKATGFARQSMKIRSGLESQVKEMKQELNRKQTTISSLIKALEKEKSRTQADVTLMAKQLRLHEKQLQARRTLEEVSRSVDSKLSNRLVKKVAKARG